MEMANVVIGNILQIIMTGVMILALVIAVKTLNKSKNVKNNEVIQEENNNPITKNEGNSLIEVANTIKVIIFIIMIIFILFSWWT